jgi:hypothetical protein
MAGWNFAFVWNKLLEIMVVLAGLNKNYFKMYWKVHIQEKVTKEPKWNISTPGKYYKIVNFFNISKYLFLSWETLCQY